MEAATPYGLDSLRDGRGLVVSDFDGDGDLDFIVNNYRGAAHYFANEAARGHWIRVRLRGRTNNRDGVGAIIRATTGDRKQMRVITAGEGYASQNSRTVHFGIGEARSVDELEVVWPNGRMQRFRGVVANRVVEIDEDAVELSVRDGGRR